MRGHAAHFIALSLGILLCSYLNYFLLVFCLFCIVNIIFIYYKKHRYLIISLFFIIGYLFTYIDNIFSANHFNTYMYNVFNKDIYGYVCDDIDFREKYFFITLCIDSIYVNDKHIKIHDKILIKDYTKQNIKYGDNILLKSPVLNIPFENTDFSYKKYLMLDDIHFITDIKEENKNNIIILNGFKGSSFLLWVYDLKKNIKSNVYQIYDSDIAGLLLGFILGYKDGIKEDIILSFRNTGLSHLLVVSGANITFLSAIVFFVFGSISRFIAVPILIVIIIIFVFLTGADASIVRAGIMGILTYISLFLGRQSLSLDMLFITGIIMLLLNPYILLYDVGFQLSFLATFAIIYAYPYLQNKFKLNIFINTHQNKNIFIILSKYLVYNILSVFIISLAITVFTLPIIILNFHSFSVISPISNVLVFWIPPLIMIFGYLSILFAFLSQVAYIGFIFNYINTICILVASYLVNIIRHIVVFIDKTFNIIVNV